MKHCIRYIIFFIILAILTCLYASFSELINLPREKESIAANLWFVVIIICEIAAQFVISLYQKKKINDYYNSPEFKALQEIQRRKQSKIQAELEIKKMKFKRKRCRYCNTLNFISNTNCINCAAPLD